VVLALTLALIAAVSADNLLANPGFEEAVNEQPASWDVYLLDPERSLARIDSAAYAGERSVLLQNALPYDNEPYNNWSQNVLQPLGGKRLRAEASIRTETAGAAALWVQCWRKKPLRVLHLADSSLEAPVAGTSDWQQVSVYFTAPPETDFVTVRCVLTGSGTAWFDGVSLEIQPGETADTISPPSEARRETSARTGRQEMLMPQMPALPVSPVAPLPPELQSTDGFDAMSGNADALLQGAALRAAVEAMQHSNSAMLEELEALRDELQRLKADLPKLNEPAPPPLVPHEGFE
jgi:hypothetical protein